MTTVLVMDLRAEEGMHERQGRRLQPLFKTAFNCTRLFLHGFGGEVLAEVSHHVERVVRRSGEDASGGLETQVCAGSMGDKKNQSI